MSCYVKVGTNEQKKAYDMLVQCEAGLVSVTGTEEEPSKAGISIADIAAGMYAYTGILTALMNRMKTGEGTVMEVSMLEALGEWMGYPAYYAAYGGKEPSRTGASHSTIYPYGPFVCGDGKTVFIGLQNEREWKQFCEKVLNNEELKQDERFNSNWLRSENRQALKALIEKEFETMTSDVVIERVEGAKIANARLNNMQDFFNHPQLKARNRWQEVNTPTGTVNALIPPVTMNGFDPVMKDVPALGEHTEKIL